jgi:hypothetical protein
MYEYFLIPLILLTILDCNNIHEEKEDFEGYIELMRNEILLQNLEIE